MNNTPEIPNELPEELEEDCNSLEACLLSDLRGVLAAYARSGLTMAAVVGCLALVLREEQDDMLGPYARTT